MYGHMIEVSYVCVGHVHFSNSIVRNSSPTLSSRTGAFCKYGITMLYNKLHHPSHSSLVMANSLYYPLFVT